MPEAAEVLKCPKGICGKPYERAGKFYDRHVAACDGKTKWEPGAAAPKAPAAAAKQPSHIEMVLQEAVVRKEAVGREIALLEQQLEARKKEQAQLDGVIQNIQKAKEG